jgi:RimJ/RimL family protein N-acetyltransferase
MEKEDTLKLVFYEKPGEDTPFQQHSDLADFIVYMGDPKKIVLLVQDAKEDQIAGLIWLDGVVPGWRANGNFWMRRRYWGESTKEAVMIGLDYVFHALDIQTVWTYSPWLTSVKTTNRCGFEYVVSLPDFALVNGQPRDIHISRFCKVNYKR